jgi:hypothetical protein
MPSSKTLVALLFGLLLGVLLASAVSFTDAQQPTHPPIQLPTIQTPCKTTAKAKEKTIVLVSGQGSAPASGKVLIEKLDVHYDPGTDAIPLGGFVLRIDLDESPNTIVESETVDQLTSYGKHTPTMAMSGRCKVHQPNSKEQPTGCRYWVLIANNTREPLEKRTPDIVSFLVVKKTGERIAYGTGTVVEGDVQVTSSN